MCEHALTLHNSTKATTYRITECLITIIYDSTEDFFYHRMHFITKELSVSIALFA